MKSLSIHAALVVLTVMALVSVSIPTSASVAPVLSALDEVLIDMDQREKPVQSSVTSSNNPRQPFGRFKRPNIPDAPRPTLFGEAPTASTPKVFGIGLSRTGGTSLAAALKELGLTCVFFDRDFNAYLPHSAPYSFAGLYDDVDCVLDLPTAFYPAELLAAYPQAKFIATHREPKAWFNSFRQYLQVMFPGYMPTVLRRLHETVYGTEMPNESVWIQSYKKHYVNAAKVIPHSQLMTLEVESVKAANPFPAICKFIGLTSCADKAYPHENSLEKKKGEVSQGNAARLAAEASLRDLGEKEAKSNYAYVTLLSGTSDSNHKKEFIYSSLVWCKTVKESYNSPDAASLSYDVVAMTTDDLSLSDVSLLKTCFTRIVPIEAEEHGPRGMRDNAFWSALRSKFSAWSLTEYSRVIFMDADQMVVKNLDELFFREYYDSIRVNDADATPKSRRGGVKSHEDAQKNGKSHHKQHRHSKQDSVAPIASSNYASPAPGNLHQAPPPNGLFVPDTVKNARHHGSNRLAEDEKPVTATFPKPKDLYCLAAVAQSPVNTAIMSLAPSLDVSRDISSLFTYGDFSEEKGWFEYGLYTFDYKKYEAAGSKVRIGKTSELVVPAFEASSVIVDFNREQWNFYAAWADQGMTLYYFYLLNPSMGGIISRELYFKGVIHFIGGHKPWLHGGDKASEVTPEAGPDAAAWEAAYAKWHELAADIKSQQSASDHGATRFSLTSFQKEWKRQKANRRGLKLMNYASNPTITTDFPTNNYLSQNQTYHLTVTLPSAPSSFATLSVTCDDGIVDPVLNSRTALLKYTSGQTVATVPYIAPSSYYQNLLCNFVVIASDSGYNNPGGINFAVIGVTTDWDGDTPSNGQSTLYLKPSVAPVGGLTVDVSCNFGTVTPSRLIFPDDSIDYIAVPYTAPGFAASVVCSASVVPGLGDPRFAGDHIPDMTFQVYAALTSTIPPVAIIGNNIDITLTPSQAIVGSALVVELACDSGSPTNRLRYNFPVGSSAAQKVTYGIAQFATGTPVVQCNFTQISGDTSFINNFPGPFTLNPTIGLTITSSASLPSVGQDHPAAPATSTATLTLTPTTTIATADLLVNVYCTLQGAAYPSSSPAGTNVTFAVGTKTAAQVTLNVAATDYGQITCTAMGLIGDARYLGLTWNWQTYIGASLTWTKFPNATDIITADSSVTVKISANVPVIGALSLSFACNTGSGALPSTATSFDWADGESGERTITVSFGGTLYGPVTCMAIPAGSTTDMRYSFAYSNLNGIRFTAYAPVKATSQLPTWDTPYTVQPIPYNSVSPQYFTEQVNTYCTNCQISNPLWNAALPFPFSFFGSPQTSICLAGTYVSFHSNFGGCSYHGNSAAPPDFNAVNPPNVISLGITPSIAWQVRTFTLGVTPNRRFIIDISSNSQMNGQNVVTGNIVLHEGSNIIDIRLNSATNFGTQWVGLQNAVGDAAVLFPGLGYYDGLWSVYQKAYRFTPTYIPIVPLKAVRTITAYPAIAPYASSLSWSYVCSYRTGSFQNGFSDTQFYNQQATFGVGATAVNATTYSVTLPDLATLKSNAFITCSPVYSGGDSRFVSPYNLAKSFTFTLASVEVDITFPTTGWYDTIPVGSIFPVTFTPSAAIKDTPLIMSVSCTSGTGPSSVTLPVGNPNPVVLNFTAPKVPTASVNCSFAYSSGDARFAGAVGNSFGYSTAVYSTQLSTDLPGNGFSVPGTPINFFVNVSTPSAHYLTLTLECTPTHINNVKKVLLAKNIIPIILPPPGPGLVSDTFGADIGSSPDYTLLPEYPVSTFRQPQFNPDSYVQNYGISINPFSNSGVDTTCSVTYFSGDTRFKNVFQSITFHNAKFTFTLSMDSQTYAPGPAIAKNSAQTATVQSSKPVIESPVHLQLVCFNYNLGNGYAAPINATIAVGSSSVSVPFTTFDATSGGTTVECYWQYNPDFTPPLVFSNLDLPTFYYTSYPLTLSSINMWGGSLVIAAWSTSITVVPSVEIIGTPLVISVSCTAGTLGATTFTFPVGSTGAQSVPYTTASTFTAATCTFAYVSGDSRFQNQLPSPLSFSTGTANWVISGSVSTQYYHPVSTSRTLTVALPFAPSGSTSLDVTCNGVLTTLTYTTAAAQTVTFTTPSTLYQSFTCSIAYNSGDSTFNLPTRTSTYQTDPFTINYSFNYSIAYSPNSAPVVPPNTQLRLYFDFDHAPEAADVVLTPQCTGAKIISPNGGKMTLTYIDGSTEVYFDLITPPSGGNAQCTLTKNSGSDDWAPALASIAPMLYFNTTFLNVSFVANNSVVAYDRPVDAMLTGNVLAAPIFWQLACDHGTYTPSNTISLFTTASLTNKISYIGDSNQNRVLCRILYLGSSGPGSRQQPYFHSLDNYNVMFNVVDYHYDLTAPYTDASVAFAGQSTPFILTPSYFTANETGIHVDMMCYIASSNSYKTYTFAFSANSMAPVTVSAVFSSAGYISCNFTASSTTSVYPTFYVPNPFAFSVIAAPTLSASALPAIVFSGDIQTVSVTPSIPIFRKPLNIAYSCIGAPASGVLNFPVTTTIAQSFNLNVPVGQDIDSASCSFTYVGGDARYKAAAPAVQSFRVIFPRLTASTTLPPPFVFPVIPAGNTTGNGTDSLPSIFNNITLPQIPVVVRAGDNFTFSVNANTPVVGADLVLSFQCTYGTYLQTSVNATSVFVNNVTVPAVTIPVGATGPASILYYTPQDTELGIQCTLAYVSGDNRFAPFTQTWQFDAVAPVPPTLPTTPLVFVNSTYTNVNDLVSSPVPVAQARVTVSLSFPASASVGTQPATYWTTLVTSFATTLGIDPARLQLQMVDFPNASNSSASSTGSTTARLVLVVLPPVNGGASYNASSPTAATDLLTADDIASKLNDGFKTTNSPLNQKLTSAGIGVQSVSVQSGTVTQVPLTDGGSSSGLSQGAKIGIGVGVGVGGFLVLVAIFVLFKRSAVAAAKVADTTTATTASSAPTGTTAATSAVEMSPA